MAGVARVIGTPAARPSASVAFHVSLAIRARDTLSTNWWCIRWSLTSTVISRCANGGLGEDKLRDASVDGSLAPPDAHQAINRLDRNGLIADRAM